MKYTLQWNTRNVVSLLSIHYEVLNGLRRNGISEIRAFLFLLNICKTVNNKITAAYCLMIHLYSQLILELSKIKGHINKQQLILEIVQVLSFNKQITIDS